MRKSSLYPVRQKEAMPEACWSRGAEYLNWGAEMTEITTVNTRPPIPLRCFDWCAYRDPEGIYGWGATETAAIADLEANEEEQQAISALSQPAMTAGGGEVDTIPDLDEWFAGNGHYADKVYERLCFDSLKRVYTEAEVRRLLKCHPAPVPVQSAAEARAQRDIESIANSIALGVVQSLADSEPTEKSEIGMDVLTGTDAEGMFVLDSESVIRVVANAIDNAVFDGVLSIPAAPPKDANVCARPFQPEDLADDDPLKQLGAFLANLLDDDRWPTAERYLLAVLRQREAVQGRLNDSLEEDE
jgi:hypothetical protein